MNIVLSESDTGKAYSKKTEQPVFLGKKIGDTVDLGEIGLADYKAKISGGSDKNGFPMRKNIGGTGRKKIFISGGPGFNPTRKGERTKKSVRGNIISPEINQLNLVIIEAGKKKLEELLKAEPGAEEEKKEAKKGESKKEEAAKKREEEAKAVESKEEKKQREKEEAKKAEAEKGVADLIADVAK